MRFWRTSPPPPPLPPTILELYLAHRPDAALEPSTFASRRVALPAQTPTQALVKTLYLSCDPAMRVWLSPARSYMPPVPEGARMRAFGVGEVVRPGPALRVGDLVEGMLGWGEYAALEEDKLKRVAVPRGLPPSVMLGVLGITGLTAYFGLLQVGALKRGETVVVSAAAGATGSVVCQIAKNVYGCRVVGIAGGTVKCRYLEDVLGVAAVDYKSEEGVDAGLKRVLGKSRIDVYFDNVGGKTLEAALRRIAQGARIVVCGAISGYNKKELQPGPYNYVNLISYGATMRGFLLREFEKEFDRAKADLSRWIREGKVDFREDVVNGLENAPEGMKRLFEGKNIGKVVIRVAEGGTGVQAKL
ncbi:unnamed protein product [Chondrus crispus]|uniref:Enoyl reductase (ER) domain-containing protein n=1 Tax=Chondrus crispus TaxID=2769 RepID=R7QNV3_CHOCR|nr:unnamed protein product [Chondrus crispus]CDF39050.1 unnamed protein product [Chondrus crispus]|eukprot:XP_005718961.1 unnamed protein product [Chondrus crispus]